MPLTFVAYSLRIPSKPAPRVGRTRGSRSSTSRTRVTIARSTKRRCSTLRPALLEHGADPNAGYLWHGLPTPFTVLTGVFGEGEAGPRRQPRHPHTPALARLLLDSGADPNDGQALYNRMFERGNDHLELLFEFGLGSGDGGPWRAHLRDAIASPAELVHSQLEWAVDHDMAARVVLLVEHGADVNAPFANGRTPYESATRNGNTEVVEYLAACGATAPSAPFLRSTGSWARCSRPIGPRWSDCGRPIPICSRRFGANGRH